MGAVAFKLRLRREEKFGMAWEPLSGALWTSVNERDEPDSDLVPDDILLVRDGGFYDRPSTIRVHFWW